VLLNCDGFVKRLWVVDTLDEFVVPINCGWFEFFLCPCIDFRRWCPVCWWYIKLVGLLTNSLLLLLLQRTVWVAKNLHPRYSISSSLILCDGIWCW
jgi:hypothetical protein